MTIALYISLGVVVLGLYVLMFALCRVSGKHSEAEEKRDEQTKQS